MLVDSIPLKGRNGLVCGAFVPFGTPAILIYEYNITDGDTDCSHKMVVLVISLHSDIDFNKRGMNQVHNAALVQFPLRDVHITQCNVKYSSCFILVPLCVEM